MPGSMRQRGEESWQLRVHAGRDPITSRKRYIERTFRGNKRQASKALAALVTETDRRVPRSTKAGTVGALLNEWLDHATPSFSGWGEMHPVPSPRGARSDEVPVGGADKRHLGWRYAAAGAMVTSKPRSSILRWSRFASTAGSCRSSKNRAPGSS